MKKSLNYLDLFSGIGGFALGLQKSGIKINRHFFSEIDKFAIQAYQKHFPKSKGLGDVRTIGSFSRLGQIDLVTFGFPCQDLSVAGKGKGFDGERSSLFYEATRIIREIRPTHFIFENVKGLFSNDSGRTFEKVLQEIADIGLYDCEWQLVNTSWFLPQNRERIYFIGHIRGESCPKVFPITDNNRKTDWVQRHTANTLTAGDRSSTGTYVIENQLIQKTKNNTQGKQLKSIRGDGRCLCAGGGGFAISTGLYIVPQDKNVKACPVLTPERENKRQNGRRIKDENEPAFTLTTQDRHGVLLIPEATKKSFAEIQANCGIDLTQPNSKTRRGRKMEKECHTITCQPSQFAWFDGIRIRKLTPMECERLQGFPNGWTEGFSDHQRYKMLGNAVSVPVTEFIFKRLYNAKNNNS